MTANFIVVSAFLSFVVGPHPQEQPPRARAPLLALGGSCCSWLLGEASANLNAITFDHRIRQQLIRDCRRHRSRAVRRIRGELELEILALPDILYPAVPQRVQGVDDGLSLRVEHRWLQRHEHPRAHQDTPAATGILNTRSKIWSTFLSCTFRSNASSTVFESSTPMTSVSASSSCLKSFFSSYERRALRCTHS